MQSHTKLDTAADFVFAVVCLIKLPPVVSGFVMRGRFATVHSVLNRLAGLMLFALPPTLPFIALRYSRCVVCGIATLAAIQEGHIIRTGGGVVSVASKKRMKHNHTKNLPHGAQRNRLFCFPGPRSPVFLLPRAAPIFIGEPMNLAALQAIVHDFLLDSCTIKVYNGNI